MKKQDNILNRLSSLCIKYDWKREFGNTLEINSNNNNNDYQQNAWFGKSFVDLSLNDDRTIVKSPEILDEIQFISTPKEKNPKDMDILWNKRLLTTAGITKLKYINGNKMASIELSQKVLFFLFK